MNLDLVTDLDEFVLVFDEVYEFLNALLYNNATTVYAMVPAYVAAVRSILSIVILLFCLFYELGWKYF